MADEKNGASPYSDNSPLSHSLLPLVRDKGIDVMQALLLSAYLSTLAGNRRQ